MKHMRTGVILVVIGVIGFIMYMVYTTLSNQTPAYVTGVADVGPVQQLVSITGVIENRNIAQLGFPSGGTVTDIMVRIGDRIEAGATLASLDTRTLEADRQDALASIARAVAARDELLAGVTDSIRAVSAETLTLKRNALMRTKLDQARLVENARRTLLTSDLTAVALKADEEAVAPIVSGTYTCDEEGIYQIEIFSSNSASGYSLRLSGLETGTFVASVDQPTPFGSCGLRLLLTPGERYSRSSWTITIPNQLGTRYTQNRNAYEAAKLAAESQIILAEQDLALAEATAINNTAGARPEAIAKANADIAQAEARLARVTSQIAERTLLAPFAGTVTAISAVTGETVGTAPFITLYADQAYELVARVPEVDISTIRLGQTAHVVFDTNPIEPQTATVTYLAPYPTLISGVAYYDARLALTNSPDWLRDGLNADIDIIKAETLENIRIPTRFINNLNTDPSVILLRDGSLATTSISILLIGNDGYTAINGLTTGDTVITQ